MIIPPNNGQHNQQRYSSNIEIGQENSSNAFVHLRNEISNLRTEFSKLIQKEGHVDHDRKDYKSTLPYRKEEKTVSYSTI